MDVVTAAGHDAVHDAAHGTLARVDRSVRRTSAPVSAPAVESPVVIGQWGAHPRHVARLALELFGDLAEIHGMDGEARMLVECAALSHDSAARAPGDAVPPTAASHRPFYGRQVGMVAAIRQYHQGGLPDPLDAVYCAFEPEDRRTVRWCAAILRAADGFDASGRGLVRSLLGRCHEGHLILVAGCETAAPLDVESGARAALPLAWEADVRLRVIEVLMTGEAV